MAQITDTSAVDVTPEESVTSPFCRELRSKKYYFLQEPATEDHHMLDATSHCWCRLTMQAVGPDSERAHASDCKSGRSCYRTSLPQT